MAVAADIVRLGVTGLAQAFRERTISAREATTAYLARIEGHNPALNAFLHVAAEAALAQAEQSDARHARGEPLSALDGVPIGLKDNIDLAGAPTTSGLAHARIARADAEVTAALRQAGAVFLGKLNMDEGALGGSTINPHHGATHNPYRLGYSPGGSSGGAAAAVAAGLCAAALGTDTLGSVRLPAAFCGVVGFKPAYGAIPAGGVTPLSPSLDHVGPLTRCVGDLHPILAATIDGWTRAETPADLSGLRVGQVVIPDSLAVDPGCRAAVEAVAALLASLGAQVRPVTLAYDFAGARGEAVRVIQTEAASGFEGELTAHPDAFSAAFRKHLEAGAARSPERFEAARAALAEVRAGAADAFAETPVLLMPTTLREAFAQSSGGIVAEGDVTAYANIVGAPAITLPAGLSAGGLPLGVQLVADRTDSALLLAVATALEARLPAPPRPRLFL